MAKVEVSQTINAPVAVVFDQVDDHEKFAQFFRAGSGLEWTTPRHEVGTKLKMEAKAAGVAMPVEMETTEVVPESRLAGIYTSGMKGNWQWRFDQAGIATNVAFSTDYELPMGILGQLADRTLVERELRADMERTLAMLKERAEGSVGTA